MKITKIKLRALLGKGMKVKDIANLFNCSRQAIYQAARKYRIKIKPKSKAKNILCKKCTNLINAA